jgi:hypothetical protein
MIGTTRSRLSDLVFRREHDFVVPCPGMPIAVLIVVLVLASGCGGASTSLAPIDVRAQQNQQRAALAILAHTAGTDAGAIESLAESVYCGAGGTLRRAGQSTIDAGVPCP